MSEQNAEFVGIREIAAKAVAAYLVTTPPELLDADEIGQEVTWALAQHGYVITYRNQKGSTHPWYDAVPSGDYEADAGSTNPLIDHPAPESARTTSKEQ